MKYNPWKRKLCERCDVEVHPRWRFCPKHNLESKREDSDLIKKVQKEYMDIHRETLIKDWEAFKIDHLFNYKFKDKRGRFIKGFRYS